MRLCASGSSWRYSTLYFSLRPFCSRMWLNPVSFSDNITLLPRLPHTQPRTHTEIPPEGKTWVFYLWMWAARGEKPVPRSTVSQAGSREASLTSINLLSSHPSPLHLSLSSSFCASLLILAFSSGSPLLCMSSSLFDLNVRCKGHSHHAALRYHSGFLASAKTSYSFNHHKMCRQTHMFLCTRGRFFPQLSCCCWTSQTDYASDTEKHQMEAGWVKKKKNIARLILLDDSEVNIFSSLSGWINTLYFVETQLFAVKMSCSLHVLNTDALLFAVEIPLILSCSAVHWA